MFNFEFQGVSWARNWLRPKIADFAPNLKNLVLRHPQSNPVGRTILRYSVFGNSLAGETVIHVNFARYSVNEAHNGDENP